MPTEGVQRVLPLAFYGEPMRTVTTKPASQPAPRSWSEQYGKSHRLERIEAHAVGFSVPKRVRIYRRRQHFVLQWWDPAAKRNLNQRVEGDLVAAVAKAREIDDRLTILRHSGGGMRRVGLVELIELYLQDLEKRADGGEISPATCCRLGSALEHLRRFAEQPRIAKAYNWASLVDREFRLAFSAFLLSHAVAPNGHPHAATRVLRSPDFVLDACRSMFAWACDPNRGRILPAAFANPFQNCGGDATRVPADLVGEPDITITMAADLLHGCDSFQLPLFATILLLGLRPSEITYLFREQVGDGWLNVDCLPLLGYFTKGRRNKRFPVIPCLQSLWEIEPGQCGLLFTRRGFPQTPSSNPSLDTLIKDYERRCRGRGQLSAAARQSMRDEVMLAAGCLNYDRIEQEFHRLSRSLHWPPAATLKDFRHLFCTSLANAGLPEPYRQFLMGHSPGRGAIVSYTHLNSIRDHYQRALDSEFAPCLAAIKFRARELRLPHLF